MAPQHSIHFQRPPVVETVLGVQFEALPNLRNAHLGAFWKRLGPEWPTTIDCVPLPPQVERFEETEEWAFPGLQLAFGSAIPIRMQIRNKDESRMVQVQNGRLHYNWLAQPGAEYPRYKKVRPEFDRILGEFQRFLADEKLGEIRFNQWEVVYLNQIPRGTVWNEPGDWAKLFRSLSLMRSDLTSARLEAFAGEWHYEIPPQLGRLHVQVQHGRQATPTGEPVLRLTLTARGPLSSGDKPYGNLDSGLNRGHAVIVQAFQELTSDAAHEYWGLIHEDAGS
jgi:uncharacterized protein (TIGR04255 family)